VHGGNAFRVLHEAQVEIKAGRCISHIQLSKDLCHKYAHSRLEYHFICMVVYVRVYVVHFERI